MSQALQASWHVDQAGPRWEIRGELGIGGMGRVLLVRDRWLDRDVAVKEPRTARDVDRLRREATITARLEHPGVLPVHDIGLSPAGQPWFAMRLVRGMSLDQALKRASGMEARLALLRPMLGVCETVAYAHDRGVMHRDIKPANIMLGSFGEAIVIDWGLAVTTADDTPGAAAGTPAYMSPQQAAGQHATYSDDVFSLGRVLEECLTLHEPGSDNAPSAHARGISTVVQMPLDVPPALSAIIRRATAHDHTIRYPDAKALADDLGRFLDGARVNAHTYTHRELLARLVRTWRAPLLVACLALVVLAFSGIIAVKHIADERNLARQNLATALTAAAESAIAQDDRARAEVLATHAYMRAPSPESRGVLAQVPSPRPTIQRLGMIPKGCEPVDVVHHMILCRNGDTLFAHDGERQQWARTIPRTHQVAFLGRGSHVLIASRESLVTLDAASGRVVYGPVFPETFARLDHAADGHSVLIVTPQAAIRIRPEGHSLLRGQPCGHDGLGAMALHPDGNTWVASCLDGSLMTGSWAPYAARQLGKAAPGSHPRVTALAFAPNRPLLLIATAHGPVLVRHLSADTTSVLTPQGGLVHHMLVEPSGKRAVLIGDVGAPLVVDIDAHAILGRIPLEPGTGRVIRVDNDAILTANPTSGAIEQWDFSAVLPRSIGLADGVVTVSLSPDGRHLAATHGPHLAVFETGTRRLVGRQLWPGWMVKDAAFSPDGSSIIAYGFAAHSLVQLRVEPALPVEHTLPITWSNNRIATLADGSVVRATHQGGVLLHRTIDTPEEHAARILDTPVRDLVASPDGRHLVGLGHDGAVFMSRDLDMRSMDGTWLPCSHRLDARAVGVDPGGTAAFVATVDEVTVECRRSGTLTDADVYVHRGGELTAVTASANWIAAGARDGGVSVWRRGEPEAFLRARPHGARVSEVIIDVGERWLVTGGWDGRLVFMDLKTSGPETALAVEAAWALDMETAMRDTISTHIAPREE